MKELYLEDSYKKEIKTKIVEIITIKNKPAIVLEKNIFYPSGGGQPYDTGYIKESNGNIINVLRIIKQNGKIYLCLDDFLSCEDNTDIEAYINWDLRYQYMKSHTAAHLLMSEIKNNVKDYEPEGIEISNDGKNVVVNFYGVWDKREETAKNIINNINSKIKDDIKVFDFIFDNNLNDYKDIYRGDRDLNKGSRIVIIKDIDANPCGGTHLRNLKEITEINLIGYTEDKFEIEVI